MERPSEKAMRITSSKREHYKRQLVMAADAYRYARQSYDCAKRHADPMIAATEDRCRQRAQAMLEQLLAVASAGPNWNGELVI